MPTIEEAIKRLKDYNKPGDHVALAIWSEEDALGRAKELHIHCTRKEAQDILDEIDRQHDATMGITWDTLDDGLYNLKSSRNNKPVAV